MMGGRIVREGHVCDKPRSNQHQPGTIWQCDCLKYWRLSGSGTLRGWVSMSLLEVAFSGIAKQEARA